MLDRDLATASPISDAADESATASPRPFTYAQLLSQLAGPGRDVTEEETHSPSASRKLTAVVRNRRTALRRFLQANGLVASDTVGDELAEGMPVAMAIYCAWEMGQGTAKSTLRSRCSHLRGVARDLRGSGGAASFSALLDSAINASGLTLGVLASRCGIGANSLSQWRRGLAAPGRHRSKLSALEGALKLKQGLLLGVLPLRTAREKGYGVDDPAPSTAYRARLHHRAREAPFALQAGEALRAQWARLLDHKTAELPRLERNRRGRWAAKPARMYKPLKPHWCCTLPDGRVSSSALAVWIQVRQYLGWLTLGEAEGGGGIDPAAAQTLAWLADCKRVKAFVHWRAERAGALNMGALTFLHTVVSLLHPKSGWLTQSPWLSSTAPDLCESGIAWSAHCSTAFDKLKAFVGVVQSSAKPTRDVEEPLRPLLASGNAVGLLFGMLERMERDMPAATQPCHRAIHQRDIALVSLLMANPLRIGQLAALEYGSGTDQNLRRTESGWRLECAGERFKNGGTTMRRGLAVDLDDWLTKALDRYQREGRPALLAGRSSRYFLVGRRPWDPTGPCENLEDRLQLLTRRYLDDCPGFRGHGWRHLLATAWLQEHPEDYGTVADLLGDSVETVAAAYRHIERANSVKRFGAWARRKRR